MRFWDASALIPLCCRQPASDEVQGLLGRDDDIVVWWGSRVECASALARLERESAFDAVEFGRMRDCLTRLSEGWSEVLAGESLREEALRILRRHPLRAADALQLAAALTWVAGWRGSPQFVCLDARLRQAALREGFELLPG